MDLKPEIYCIEDDSNIRELIDYTLTQSGFKFTGFESAGEFEDKIASEKPDLILLDIMLPDKDGMKILKELRSHPETKSIPVIMLTAKSGRMDKIKGLDAGADDYITKPFDVLELISRIKAVLRRIEKKSSQITYKNIIMNVERRQVFVDSEGISLTYKEFELLHMLILNEGIVLERDKILNSIWGFDFEGKTRTVDMHIKTLRQKLMDAGNYIETVRNVGYRIN